MKKLQTIGILFISLFLFVFSLPNLSAQEQKTSAKLSEFKISIERSENGFKLHSLKGSSWIDLSFSLSPYKTQAVDENGMADIKDLYSSEDANLSNYLFTITLKGDKILLKGLEGTAWKELSFTLPKYRKQVIDQSGMSE